LDVTLQEVVNHPKLLAWLRLTGRKMAVATHINHKSQIELAHPDLVEVCSPHEIVDRLLRCEVFVSDYSGTVCDALLLDKPVVFFPFDLDAYLRVRHLYCDYEEFAFGPIVRTTDELVEALVDERWADLSVYRRQRDLWADRMFVSKKPGYCDRSYNTICQLLREHPE